MLTFEDQFRQIAHESESLANKRGTFDKEVRGRFDIHVTITEWVYLENCASGVGGKILYLLKFKCQSKSCIKVVVLNTWKIHFFENFCQNSYDEP